MISDDRTSQGAAPAESWEPLYDRWHRLAYRGTPKPTSSQEIDRMQEFLKMVKKCECGEWHLEIGSKCRACDERAKKTVLPG